MEIERFKPKVNVFHYEAKEEYKEYQTRFDIHITPLRIAYPLGQEESCTLGVRIDYTMVFDEFLISGSISQVNQLFGRQIDTQEDVTNEELNEIIAPMFELLQRLTYEVSEISLDEPGVTIQFDQVSSQENK
ncbi:hypothetical protein IGI37_003222 [Enterococcus sp. AZ194]|uniref:DUF1149 family protein n=1 Tax=Enterococcus sp. AZ194 TaxID=2774629 RepID=UPI003F26AFB3